jgi:hypothetical protein
MPVLLKRVPHTTIFRVGVFSNACVAPTGLKTLETLLWDPFTQGFRPGLNCFAPPGLCLSWLVVR